MSSTDLRWVIEGATSVGKNVGDEMSDEHRAQILRLIRDQNSDIIYGREVHCPCGRVVNVARKGYRCFFCGVVFCGQCAKIHFTKRENQDVKEGSKVEEARQEAHQKGLQESDGQKAGNQEDQKVVQEGHQGVQPRAPRETSPDSNEEEGHYDFTAEHSTA